jgi:predicted permease
MSTLVQDVRFALRLLLKDRSFSLTAVVTLAVSLGANAAVFAIVRSVVMTPLPFPASERAVLLYNSYPAAGAPRVGNAVPDYYDRLAAVPALEASALLRREGLTYGDPLGPERVIGIRATPSFFQVVAVRPLHGRVFTEAEGEPGANQKAILSYGFWQRKLGGQPSAVGQTVQVNGAPVEVVGVLPAEFTFLQNDVELFLPAAFQPQDKADNRRHSNNWQMVGRLAPGASVAIVKQQVDALNRGNDDRFPQFRQILADAKFETVVVGLQDDLIRDVRDVLYLLWGGVAFVLVIGCVNIANLVIVRGSARRRELATRHAIGADVGRLARQLFTETTLLAVAGGALGLGVGWWAIRSVASLNLDQLPRGYEIGLTPLDVAVVVAATLAVGLVLGLAPALRLRRMNLNIELREESRGGTSSRRATLVRQALATVQVAIALTLLIGAGLLLASFRAVMQLDFGFAPDGVTTSSVTLPAATYPDPPSLAGFGDRALAALRAVPGVEAAGITSIVPFTGAVTNNVIMAEGYVMKPGESLLAPMQGTASGGYFETMRIGLVKGRLFDERDTAESPRVAIVDERLAERFWAGRDPLAGRLYFPSDPANAAAVTPDTQFFNVVGVVREVQMNGPTADFAQMGMFYFPFSQTPFRGPTFVVRARADAAAALPDVRRAVASIDPQLPVFRQQTMQEWIDRALVGRRAPMLIALGFGAVALFLSAIGIYGVLAYGVAERHRELGVRMALGGSAGSVLALVLADGVRIILIGVVAGLAGAWGVGRLMQSLLYGVSPMSPAVVAAVTLTLTAVALVASVVPAIRASRINPIVVLGK